MEETCDTEEYKNKTQKVPGNFVANKRQEFHSAAVALRQWGLYIAVTMEVVLSQWTPVIYYNAFGPVIVCAGKPISLQPVIYTPGG